MRALVLGSSLGAVFAALAQAGCARDPTEGCTATTSQGLDVCATGATLKGVDVSTYQGTVDWTKVKAAGMDFAFARISDGTANPDDQFTANWQGMKAAGLVRGAYQYWRAGVDPAAQAELVTSSLSAAGGLAAGDLPVVMDIETDDGQSAATIEANMQTWLNAVKASTGIDPLIYTSEGTYPISATTYDTYSLWVANYGANCPAMPVGWTSWVFWQNGDNGMVDGISGATDTDLFNGTLAQLMTFASAPTDAGSGSSSGSGSGSGGSSSGSLIDGGDAGGHAASSSSGGTPCGS